MDIGITVVKGIREKVFALYKDEHQASDVLDTVLGQIKAINTPREYYRIAIPPPFEPRFYSMAELAPDKAIEPLIIELRLDKVYDGTRRDAFPVWRLV